MISHREGLSKDDGVSPVIGVILLVAITVVLAAVIAAFVFGYMGAMGSTKIVSVVISKSIGDTGLVDTARLSFMGGKDSELLAEFRIVPVGNVVCNPAKWTSGMGVGGSIECVGFTDGDPVTVVGLFTDNTNQVLLDTKF